MQVELPAGDSDGCDGKYLRGVVLEHAPTIGDGQLTFADGVSAPGCYVELRAERDVVCVLSNCPQLNNPCNAYNPTPIEVLIWDPS